MENHKSAGYGKALKSVGVVLALFIAMGWVLAKTEENDKQIKLRLAASTSVQIAPPPVAEPVQPKVMTFYYTPEELQAEFKANEVRISHKLSGNRLVLEGKISDIGLSFDKPVIGISVPGTYDKIKVYFDSSMTDMVSRLNVGDSVQVSSRDVSLNPFGTIHLRDASLFNNANN